MSRILAFALALLCMLHAPARAAPVQTEGGAVEGVADEHGVVFRGIPFAAPPVGRLRWREPDAPAPWSGTKVADRFSPVCMQRGSYPEDSPPEPMSEDCLYLNVWKPADKTAGRLPVMVWVYGGGLQNGSASTPLYAGDRLARRGVIVVTFNYRIGVLGFLAHPDLSRESPNHVSGNYGLLDQVAALKWVHRNIAAFGGDPDRVTVFGQSSGAISISALVTSPLARGLFRGAIAQSGGLLEPIELADDFKLTGAEQAGLAFARRVGAPTLEALRSKPAAEIIGSRFSPNPVVDGYVLPRPPYDSLREGLQNEVDLLVGSNADEGEAFLVGRTITVANMNRELESDFPPFLVSLVGPAPGAADRDARSAAVAFESNMRFAWDMWAWAGLQARQEKHPVYLYRFTRVPPYPADDKRHRGASHGMEMQYVFDHLDQQPLPWTPRDRELASLMSAYWTQFAKSGDPNGPGLPAWPRFTQASPRAMLLGEEVASGPVPGEASLKQIHRVYGTIRFAVGHTYLLIALAVTVVAAVGASIWAFMRSRRRRRLGVISASAP